jgi:hypothetical protein
MHKFIEGFLEKFFSFESLPYSWYAFGKNIGDFATAICVVAMVAFVIIIIDRLIFR